MLVPGVHRRARLLQAITRTQQAMTQQGRRGLMECVRNAAGCQGYAARLVIPWLGVTARQQ